MTVPGSLVLPVVPEQMASVPAVAPAQMALEPLAADSLAEVPARMASAPLAADSLAEVPAQMASMPLAADSLAEVLAQMAVEHSVLLGLHKLVPNQIYYPEEGSLFQNQVPVLVPVVQPAEVSLAEQAVASLVQALPVLELLVPVLELLLPCCPWLP